MPPPRIAADTHARAPAAPILPRRLFDSQNNNRGGSNVGSLYFYPGEKVRNIAHF